MPELCEIDGVWEDNYGSEHYWSCGNVATVELVVGDSTRYKACQMHAEQWKEGSSFLPVRQSYDS